jgi:hypothetical protein
MAAHHVDKYDKNERGRFRGRRFGKAHPMKKPDADFTKRLLMSLVGDAVEMEIHAARVRAQVVV